MKAGATPTVLNVLLRVIQIAVLTHGACGRRSDATNSILDGHDEDTALMKSTLIGSRSNDDVSHGLAKTAQVRRSANEMVHREGASHGFANAAHIKRDATETRSIDEVRDDLAKASHINSNSTDTFPAKRAHRKFSELRIDLQGKAHDGEGHIAGRTTSDRTHDNLRAGAALVELSEWTRALGAARLAVSAWTQQPSTEVVGIVVIVVVCVLVVGMLGTAVRQYLQHSDSSSTGSTSVTAHSSHRPQHTRSGNILNPRGRRRSLEEIRAERSETAYQTDPEFDGTTSYKERRMRKAHTAMEDGDGTSSLPVGRSASHAA